MISQFLKTVSGCVATGTAAVVGVALLSGSADGQAVVDFESQVVGTQFGSGFGQVPGDLLFNENGVDVRIDNYTLGAFTGFNFVTIGGFTDPSFPTTPATINNVRLDFDIASLGYAIDGASFEYADFGGSENLVVNGTTLELANFAAAPPSVAGVNLSVAGTAAAGTVTLSGPITSLAIGGQELGIDNVRFVPEPASALLIGLGGLAMLKRRRA